MKSLKYLNKFFYKYRFRILIGILITIIARIFALVAPNLIGDSITIIDNYLSNGNDPTIVKKNLINNILLIISASITAGFLTFIMRQTLINVSRFIEFDLKNEIFQKYQDLDINFYKNNRVGDLMNRISEDVSKVRMYVGPALMYSINTITLFIIIITYMFSIDVKLTLYTVTPLPLLSFIIYKLSKKINIKSLKVQESLSKLTTIAQESFSGISIIKSYTIEDELNKHIQEISTETKNRHVDLAKFQSWFLPMMVLLIGVSNILVIYIGGNQFIDGKIELGILAEFIIYVNMLTWPVATVGWVTSIVQQAEASQARINQFLKEKIRIINKNSEILKINGDLEFKNINFIYEETNIKALSDINFRLQKGESLGIIGPVGSGKSTLLELIVRNYDPMSGEILIDNLNLKKHNKNNIRENISYVPQTTFLFSDTIKNNIRFGKNDAQMAEIKKYSKISCVSDEIEDFPQKFDSILGERGINLSGGQKQRIALARALIKKPKILLLDDCLSAVDLETENEITSNLLIETGNITKVIVSQRTSTIKKCNKIIVLKDGKIIEEGNHEELIMNPKGYYYQINYKQNKKNQ
ncbi:ABC transporter ATP-binding protein/permease [Flavobacteriales bacterium]|nr:ABC transporter ATP-binding protein/permease [Flavobacteriales bacterium]